MLRLGVAIRPLRYIDGLTIPDDAYLALTIARNIAKGLGPLYSLDFTNGFQPLYVFLMTPIYWLFPHDLNLPVHLALTLLALFDTATLYLLYKLTASKSQSSFTPLIIAAAWIFNPYIIATSNNGLETSLSLFFVVSVYYYYQSNIGQHDLSAKTNRDFFVLGLLLGLSLWARIDNILLVFAVIALLTFSAFGQRLSFPRLLRFYLIIALGAIMVYLPWLAYSYRYTGDLLPISGKAVRYMSLATVGHQPTWDNWYRQQISEGLRIVVGHNRIYLAALGALLIGLPLFFWQISLRDMLARLKAHNLYLLFSLIIFTTYMLYVFGTWYFSRYLYPVMLLFLFFLATLIDLYNTKIINRNWRRGLNLGIIIFIVSTSVLRPSFRNLYLSTDIANMGYMNLGLWARNNFPDSTTVGSSQTGALGYFANNLRVVNLDGVVNKRCFEALQRKDNMGYIHRTGVEYVIGWEINIDFIKWETADFHTDDLRFVQKIEPFRSWYFDWYVYKVKHPLNEN